MDLPVFADDLKLGVFHSNVKACFAPQVVRYVDLMESSIGQSIHRGYEKETWEMKGWADVVIVGDSFYIIPTTDFHVHSVNL